MAIQFLGFLQLRATARYLLQRCYFLNQSVQEIQGGCNYAVSRLLLKPFGILMAQVSNRLGPARGAPTTITIRDTNAGHFLHAQDAVDLQ